MGHKVCSIFLSLFIILNPLNLYAKDQGQMVHDYISLVKNFSPDKDNLQNFIYLLEQFNIELSKVTSSVIDEIDIGELKQQVIMLHQMCKVKDPDLNKIQMLHEAFISNYGGHEPGFWENLYNGVYDFFTSSYVVNTGRFIAYVLLGYLVKDNVGSWLIPNYGVSVDENGKVVVAENANLEGTTKIDLHRKNVRDISELSKFKNLKELNLLGNTIKEISALKELIHLEFLDLRFNKIRDFSPLSNLTKMEVLAVGNNAVNDYKEVTFLKKLTNLTSLHLDMWEFDSISLLYDLPKLTYLDISSGHRKDITGISKKFPNLTQLDLGASMLNDISPLVGLRKLKELDLSVNGISDLSPLKSLTHLEVLLLNYNKITNLAALKALKSLRILNVANNDLLEMITINKLKKYYSDRGQRVEMKF